MMLKYGLNYLLLLSYMNILALELTSCEGSYIDLAHILPKYMHLSTRPLKGGDLQEAEHELRIILVRLSEEMGPFYRVSSVYSGTEEVVSGLKLLHAELIDFNNVGHDCKIEITSRSGYSASTRAIGINCSCMTDAIRYIDI